MNVAAHLMPRARARRILRRYEGLLADAVNTGWNRWERVGAAAAIERGQLRGGSRASMISDWIAADAAARFVNIGGASVVYSYRRPRILLAGGELQVRFKKLDQHLRIGTPTTGQQLALAYHQLAPSLPGMPSPTVITAGYVLNDTETDLARIVAVCHYGADVYYSVDLRPSKAHVAAAPRSITPAPAALAPVVVTSARSGNTGTGREAG